MQKSVLFLGANRLMSNAIKMVKALGHRVVVMDKNENAFAFKYADQVAIVDFFHPEKVYQYLNESKESIHAVIAANDAGVRSAAYVSEKLNIINHSIETSLACTDKGLMRTKWKEQNISQPPFEIVDNANALENAINRIGIPCVIKPCYSWGSRGVSIISEPQHLQKAIQFTTQNDYEGRHYIVEKAIEGTEYTVEGLAKNGNISILTTSDKVPQNHIIYRVAMQLNYPAQLSNEKLETLQQLVKDAAKVLGIENGAIHAECIYDGEKFQMVELAGRPGGGHIFGYIVEAVSGICMPQVLTQILLNENPNIEATQQKGACYKFFAPAQSGKFIGIEGLEKAQQNPYLLDIGFDMIPGTFFEGEVATDMGRPGFIVSKGSNREDAIKNAERTHQSLVIKIEN
ncbi:MAG: ATP-grasp domain-containing protein [Cytophagales bacterium]|nr:MAG: ATP-grasp domain-containing protein [Cytophagales bacterium]